MKTALLGRCALTAFVVLAIAGCTEETDTQEKTPLPDVSLLNCSFKLGDAVSGLDLHPGLTAKKLAIEVPAGLYDDVKAVYATNGLEWDPSEGYLIEASEAGAMDIDPIECDLYFIGQVVESASAEATGSGADLSIEITRETIKGPGGSDINLYKLDNESGVVSLVTELQLGSSALAFDPYGNLFYTVGENFLAKWDRSSFSRFAEIPSVDGISVLSDGSIFVLETDYGPKGDFPNHVLSVNPETGAFTSVLDPANVATEMAKIDAKGIAVAATRMMGASNDGTIYVGYYSTGEVIKYSADGQFARGNSRSGSRIGGVSRISFFNRGDLFFQFDSGGRLFVDYKGTTRLIASGDALTPKALASGDVASDGKHVFVAQGGHDIIALSAESGETLVELLDKSQSATQLEVLVNDLQTAAPLNGATVSLPHSGQEKTTDAAGKAVFDAIDSGIYEVEVKNAGYLPKFFVASTSAGDSAVQVEITDGRPPSFLDGLVVTVWAGPNDGIDGTGDVRADKNGDVYSMNQGGAQITKHSMGSNGELASSSVIASGGGLSNSWTVLIDDSMNIYATTGNNGVLKIPQNGQGELFLRVDPDDVTKVTDVDGNDYVISKIRDCDGLAFLSDGTLVMGSGSGGGGATTCHPNGSEDRILTMDPSSTECSQIISRGLPVGTASDPLAEVEDVIRNPDLIRADENDNIWITNKGGNIARLVTQGVNAGFVDWWMKADGEGNPQHTTSSYSHVVPDLKGSVFLRGRRLDTEINVLRLIDPITVDDPVTPDDERITTVKYYTFVEGTQEDFGGVEFVRQDATHGPEDARALIFSDGPVLIKVAVPADYDANKSLADYILENGTPE